MLKVGKFLSFFQTHTKLALCFGDAMKLNNVQITGANQNGIVEAVEKVNPPVPINLSSLNVHIKILLWVT